MTEKKAETKKSTARAGAKKGAAGSNGSADAGFVGAQRSGIAHHGDMTQHCEPRGISMIELVNEVKTVGGFNVPIPLFIIDIESAANVASTAIASIGVVAVNAAVAGADKHMTDRVVRDLSREFQVVGGYSIVNDETDGMAFNARTTVIRPSMSEQILRYGRTVNRDTQQWWAGQAAAQRSLFAVQERSVADAMYLLIEFMRDCCYGFVSAAMMASDEPTDNAQHRKLMIKALENVRVVVRGSQFDAGALESLAHAAIGAVPAVNPLQAFNNTDRYGQPTLWHFRHVSCSRSIVEGYRLGVMSALRDPEEAMRHVKALTRAAGDRVRSVVETAVDYALEELDISHVAAMQQMSADIGNGGHTPIVDCLYDAFQVLAIVSGTSGEMLASQLGGEVASD